MEKYDNLGIIGEGSYGVVIKCKHRETGQIVAIKKFLETEDDPSVKKIALREIRMLKKLRHEHLINLLEVFRRRKKLYLVFEYMDHTILDELESSPGGMEEEQVRKHIFQVVKALAFCHNNSIIHRDVKPENILVSKLGIVKLCDFGFARTMASPGEIYTDYVATRWYRAPELLLGDTGYGKEVDIWAVGCLLAEMLTGDPLFPGDSDIDQIFQITKILGPLCTKHREMMARNPVYSSANFKGGVGGTGGLNTLFPTWSLHSLSVVSQCLNVDPSKRPSASQLIAASLFTHDNFATWFSQDLAQRITEERNMNPLFTKKTPLQINRTISNRPKDPVTIVPDEKASVAKIRRLSDNEALFDEVLKKATLYGEKYGRSDRLNSREQSAVSELKSPSLSSIGIPSPKYGKSIGNTNPNINSRDGGFLDNETFSTKLTQQIRSPKEKKIDNPEKFGFLERAFERAFHFDDGSSPISLFTKSKNSPSRLPEQPAEKPKKGKIWLPSVPGVVGPGGASNSNGSSKKPTMSKTPTNLLDKRNNQLPQSTFLRKPTNQNLPQV